MTSTRLASTRARVTFLVVLLGLSVAVGAALARTDAPSTAGAQDTDYFALSPRSQAEFRERHLLAFQPCMELQLGKVLRVTNRVQDLVLPAPRMTDAYAVFGADGTLERSLILVYDDSGQLVGTQRTYDGTETILMDGSVLIEQSVGTLAESLPSMAPEFLSVNSKFTEDGSSESVLRFVEHLDANGEAFRREIEIDRLSNVVVGWRLFVLENGSERLLDSRATTFEWIESSDAPAALFEERSQ